MLREGGRHDENFANHHEVTTTFSPSPQMGRWLGIGNSTIRLLTGFANLFVERDVFCVRALETHEGDGVAARIATHSVPRARCGCVPLCFSVHKREMEVPADAKTSFAEDARAERTTCGPVGRALLVTSY
jgi:hypothetical protein